MAIFEDVFGRRVRLTDERLKHILGHSEMKDQINKIKETLKSPNIVKYSEHDRPVLLFYRLYNKTPVTRKYLLVAVKLPDKDGFIITAFFTDRIKRGETLWQEK